MVQRAEGAIAEVESYVGESALVAPIDGEVSERFPEVGELVGTGAPIMNISDLNDVWVTFSIREDLLKDIKIGSEVNAFIPGVGGPTGEVESLLYEGYGLVCRMESDKDEWTI